MGAQGHVAADDDQLLTAADLERHARDLERHAVAVAVPHRELIAGVADALEPLAGAVLGLVALARLDDVEHRRQRLQLLGRIAADGEERGVGVDEALVLEHDHALADLGERAQERLVARRLLAQRAVGGAALGDLEDHAADPEDLVVAAAAHGPVGGLELAPHAGRRARLADGLDGQVAPALEDLPQGRDHALDVGHDLADRAAELLGGRHAVDLGEVVVDAHEPQLAVVEAEPDRRAREHRVEHPVGLVGLLEQRRAVDRGGAALRELGGQHAVLGPELAAGGQRQRPELLAAREQRRHELARAGGSGRLEGDRAAVGDRGGGGLDGAQPRADLARPAQRLAGGGQHAGARRGRLAAGPDQRAAGGERADHADGEHEQDPVGRVHVVGEDA